MNRLARTMLIAVLAASPLQAQQATPNMQGVGIDEIGRVCESEGIECGFRKGGALHFATNAGQEARLRAHVAGLEALGLSDVCGWLSPREVEERVRPRNVRGGMFEPNCAVLAAVEAGTLDPERLESWRTLRNELNVLAKQREIDRRRSGRGRPR